MYPADPTILLRWNSRSSLAQTDATVTGSCPCKRLQRSGLPAWLTRSTGWPTILFLFLSCILAQAGITFTGWEPMFKGIEHASGQATVDPNTLRQQAVQALRVDLHDPDVRFFTTPRNTNGTSETLGQNTSLFLNTYHLQAAINANFYDPCCSSPPNSPMY